MAVVKNEKGKLPFGIYSKKHNRMNTLLFCIWLLLYLVFLFLICLNTNFWLYFILITFPWVFLLLFLLAKINPLNKAIRIAMNKLEIEEAFNAMFGLMKNNLHSQSKILVQIHCVNLLIDYDLEKAQMLFNGIEKPMEKNVKPIYSMVEIALLVNLNEYEEAKIKLEEFKKDFPKLIKQYESFKITIEIESTTNEIENIVQRNPINTKMIFLNVNNAFALARYYYLRDRKEEGETYANYVKENGQKLKRMYKKICEMYK